MEEEKIINGKILSDKIKENLSAKICEMSKKYNKLPSLAVIIVGDNPASQVYVRNKAKSCEKCGIESIKYELAENVSEEELFELIKKLNNDDNINGILVQLPLPKHINEKKVLELISPEKDVDCFHPLNIGKMFVGNYDFERSLLPCTPKACVKLIKSVAGDDLSGKKVCIIGRSNIVGKPVAQLLLNENCTIKIVHSKTENLSEETKWADILIVAIGKAKFVTNDMVKDDAIVIDVGINKTDDGLCGDVNFEDVIDKVYRITPVPGGVGPMTVACLMENVFNAFLIQAESSKK